MASEYLVRIRVSQLSRNRLSGGRVERREQFLHPSTGAQNACTSWTQSAALAPSDKHTACAFPFVGDPRPASIADKMSVLLLRAHCQMQCLLAHEVLVHHAPQLKGHASEEDALRLEECARIENGVGLRGKRNGRFARAQSAMSGLSSRR